ncbi:MAG: hydrogenase formation protein HypD, partial [Actinomycetia bacterium]|nr:hydrogenase formation protein HypD [Actinomycetes bacterium]
LLVSQVLVPPALAAICDSPACRVEGFLAAGHVCTVMGTEQYGPLAARHRVPIVVTGFEPLDVLHGIHRAVRQLASGEHRVENAYSRAVRPEGNPAAREMCARVFEVCDRVWRGIGMIPASGWRLREEYAPFDAERKFGVLDITTSESPDCRAGEVLQGLVNPPDCPAFGGTCTPLTPLGAPMVSSEGTCSAYFQFRR